MEMLHDLVCSYCQFIGYPCPAKCPATGVILGKYNDRAAATTCGGVITLVTERKLTSLNAFIINDAISVVTVVTNHPTSNTVTNIALDAILPASNITSCTTVEATTLKGQLVAIESAEKKLASMLNSTQSSLLGEHTFQ